MLGQYLDPVADKLLLSTLFLVLMHKGLIPARVTVLVFGRDVGILVVAAILYAAVGRREFSPSIFGKANTLAQVSAVAAVLLRQLTPAPWVAVICTLALGATMVLTVLSGLHYAWIAARRVGAQTPNGSGTNKADSQGSLRVVGGVLRFDVFFNLHIAKLFGVKDFATLQALDILGVIVPGDDSYPGVFTNGCHLSQIGWNCYSFRKIVAGFASF